MEENQIEAFLAIVSYGTFTKAAEKLYITQPALGKRITSLEKELGFDLIKRSRGVRNVELTDKGKEFTKIASKFEAINFEAKQLKHKKIKQRLRILASDGPHVFTLHDMYKNYASCHPNISLKINTTTYKDCYIQVQDKKADIAFPGINLYFKDVISVPFYEEEMLFVCREDAPYPSLVDVKQLSINDCIYTPYSTEFTTWFNYWFQDNQDSFIETHFISQAEDFLCSFHNKAWTIAPSSIVSKWKENPLLTTKKITNTPPKRTIYLVKRINNDNETINEFLYYANEYFTNEKTVKLLFKLN